MSPSHPLRIPQFRNLWLGQAISQFGDAVYYAIFMFMVAKVTGSIAAVGYVGAIETLPFLLFSPYAGVLADRIDRRRIMLLSDVVCGLLLAGFALYIAFEPKPAFWLIASVAFTLSTVRSFFIPAKNAAIPRLVPSSSLLEANAFSQMTQSFMLMGGVALAAGVSAVLYAIAPGEFFVGTFALNAISFLGSAYFIAKLPPIAPEVEVADRHPLKEIVTGGKYAIGRPELLVLMGLQALLMLCISPFFPIYVAANESWFGGKPNTLLLFEFAFMFGHILGSLWVGKSSSKWPGRAYIVGSFFVGLTVAGLAFSQHIALFILFNFAAGLAVPWASIPVMTYLQLTVPDEYRGRVNSMLNMITMGVHPVGLSLAGRMIAAIGLVWAFLVMGAGMGVAALLGLFSRAFRSLQMPSSAVSTPGDGVTEESLPVLDESPLPAQG